MITHSTDVTDQETQSRNDSAGSVRVLHLHSGNMYGGVETLLVTLARLRHLCPGMEAHFGLCFEGRLSRELMAAGVPVHFLGEVRISRPWTGWRARRCLRTLLDREHFDVVLCHMPWPLVVFGSAMRNAGPKVAFFAHGAQTGQGMLEKAARRTTPDLAIANSRFVAQTVTRLFPHTPTQVFYLPAVLPDRAVCEEWRAVARREQGVEDQTAVIIQVSRAEAWKGHLLHLRALAQLKHLNNWTCWMVGGAQNSGEARYLDTVRQTAVELGISDRIRFLGQRSDVGRLLAGADIFCQPNEGPEPFGLVFLEALWAGRPVVTTAMGGSLEILDDTCGILVEPGNPGILAAALRNLIESPEQRWRLGGGGPARAKLLCDPATQIPALHKLLQPTAARASGNAR